MYIGIDIGGTNIKTGVVDLSGSILFKNSFKTDNQSSPLTNIENIKNSIFEMLNQFSAAQSIGVGVPGIIDKNGSLNISPNLPKWHGINIQKELQKYFNLTIVVDNDANAAAVAEMEAGAGKDLNDFICVTLGTGIGGAIIIDNKIFKGTSGGAGEIGHLIINYNFLNSALPVFRQGILEELAGRKQIIANYKSRITDNDGTNQSDFDVEDIANAAYDGFTPAIECLEETGVIIGIGLASAMNLLDIPFAIIGGGISQAGEILFNSIRKTIKERSLPTISEKFEIREAYFKSDTGLIGAAMLGANKLKERTI